MKKSTSLAVLALTLTTTMSIARAESSVGLRFQGNLAPWYATFHQSDSSGHSTEVPSFLGPAMQAQLGLHFFSFVFAELSASWFLPNYLANWTTDPRSAIVANDARNVSYSSPIGINAGITIPFLPIGIEPYIGLDKSNFAFWQGTQTGYSGYSYKLGVNVFLTHSFGVKAEYRKMSVLADDGGSLPAGTSASADILFAGITFGKR